MRILKFVVDGQNIIKDPSCDFDNLVPGTKGYLQAEFSFSSEWNGCVKFVEFMGANSKDVHAVLLVNGKANIPDHIAERSVFGLRVVGENKAGFRLTTDKIIIRQKGGVG